MCWLGRRERGCIHGATAMDSQTGPTGRRPLRQCMTVRANMHSGSNWDDVTGESGPEDPDLSLISLQSLDGRPIAVLANFSMHYFSGQKALAADYFGLFSEGLQQKNRQSRRRPSAVRGNYVARLQRRYLASGLQEAA